MWDLRKSLYVLVGTVGLVVPTDCRQHLRPAIRWQFVPQLATEHGFVHAELVRELPLPETPLSEGFPDFLVGLVHFRTSFHGFVICYE